MAGRSDARFAASGAGSRDARGYRPRPCRRRPIRKRAPTTTEGAWARPPCRAAAQARQERFDEKTTGIPMRTSVHPASGISRWGRWCPRPEGARWPTHREGDHLHPPIDPRRGGGHGPARAGTDFFPPQVREGDARPRTTMAYDAGVVRALFRRTPRAIARSATGGSRGRRTSRCPVSSAPSVRIARAFPPVFRCTPPTARVDSSQAAYAPRWKPCVRRYAARNRGSHRTPRSRIGRAHHAPSPCDAAALRAHEEDSIAARSKR